MKGSVGSSKGLVSVFLSFDVTPKIPFVLTEGAPCLSAEPPLQDLLDFHWVVDALHSEV